MSEQLSLRNDRFTKPKTPTLSEDILGTHTYTGIYNPDTVDVNVNVITGEQTTEVLTADEMNIVEQRWNDEKVSPDNPDDVALPMSGEAQAECPPELQSKYPITWTCFYNPQIVGHDRYEHYKTAFNSNDYTISFDTNYNTGEISITVSEANA